MASRIGLKPLAEMCRRTATSHATGVEARKIWSREAKTGNPKKQREFKKVSDAINRGSTLAEALRETDEYLPELVYDMVHVGEQSGRVDESLNRLGQYYEQIRTLRTAFLVGIAWPAIQLILAVLAIGFVIWIMGLMSDGKEPGPDDLNTDILGFGLKGNSGLAIYFSIVGVFFVGGFFFIRSLINGRLSTLVMGPLMRVPALGPALQFMAMSRMAWALGMTVESGMPADACAEVALRSTQNAFFTQHDESIRASIKRGETFHESFLDTGAFPEDFLDAVLVGEETGRLGESMEKISQAYETQGKAVMSTLAVVAGVGVWLLVGACIVFMIFRIAFFYVGLLEDISNW